MRTACSRGSGSATLPTLAIGGIAGSTAAMFTTPFDTIKTRLQTQGVGATQSQGARVTRGVIPTMRGIVLHEGVGGLYRGVIPRLFIYMTQGAVFFTSYEMARCVFPSTCTSNFNFKSLPFSFYISTVQLLHLHLSTSNLLTLSSCECSSHRRALLGYSRMGDGAEESEEKTQR